MRRLVCGGILVCGVLAASGTRAREEAETAPAAANLPALRGDVATTWPLLHTTLRLVRDKYVAPARIVPSELFAGALKQLERDFVPVVVSRDDATGVVVVRANEHAMSFTLSKVKGLWDVAARLREVFAFLRSALKDQGLVALRDLEIAACKGLLESLDRDGAWIEGDGPSTAGLGVAVSLRDGALIVERVVPDSAASHSGLQRRDVITQIDGKLVRDMTIDEALENLRGPVGSQVSLMLRRSGKGGAAGEERFALRREGIAIASIESRQLRPGIGYIRIKHIDRSTADELSRVLEGFRERGSLEGLVLDFRDSYGGLLSEATKVADAFLEEGSLALVRGAAEGDEEKKARKDGKEPRCPLVLLTNSITASGSELIVSALQKNERAVIVGETSVGAGEIQLVFPSVVGNTAIKLTIAEFQAPAGTTVDGVGVVPDIELKSARVDPLQPRFFAPFGRVRARDRLHVFPGATSQNQPEASIWYASGADSLESIDVGEQSPRSVASDFALRLATDLVAQLPEASRAKQIDSVRPFLQSVREREMAALAAQLRALGIDWRSRPTTAGDGPQSSDFAVKVTTDRAQNTSAAGEAMTLVVTLTNRSRMPAYQVRAITKSQNADYHEKELLFGYVGPGQTVTRSVSFGRCDWASSPAAGSSGAARRTCRLSMSPAEREDIVKIAFSAERGEAPARAELRPIVRARAQLPSGPSRQSPVSIEIGTLPLTHRQERIRIKGLAAGRDAILDVRVFANEHKVLYRRGSPSPATLPFEADVPLAPGINVLRVIARNRNDVTSTRTFIVRRDGPQGEPLPAPPAATDYVW
jgi:carboxyl-terminal processing protease